jgi:hypothetical protein
MITMTVAEALAIQAKQIDHYAANYPGVAAVVAAHTDTSKLDPETSYDVTVINRHIPRGGAIEALLVNCAKFEGYDAEGLARYSNVVLG